MVETAPCKNENVSSSTALTRKSEPAAVARHTAAAEHGIHEPGDLGHQVHDEVSHVEGLGGARWELGDRLRLPGGHRQEGDHQRPGRNANEHQNRPQQLKPAHRIKARQVEQLQILHVALAPTHVAAGKLQHCRRVLLPAANLFGQHPHLVAGAAHQGRLHLIVRQDMATERRLAGQEGQVAFGIKRQHAHQRIVPPKGPAVAHPPGLTHGVGAHPVAHAELENAGKSARRGHADHEALQDANLRMRLHHAHQAHDLGARHQAVGIQRQHKLELVAPAGAEVAHVAGLVADVVAAPAVADAIGGAGGGLPGGDGRLLDRGDGAVVAVAQDEIAERGALARLLDAVLHDFETLNGSRGVLVAQGHENGSLDADRRWLLASRRVRRHGHPGIRATGVEKPQPDQRVPKTEHGPGRAERKTHEQDAVDPGPAAGAEDAAGPPQHEGVADEVEAQDDAPAARQLIDGLEARGCRKAQRWW